MDAGSCLPWRGIRWHTGRTSANAATRQTRAGAIRVPPNYRITTLQAPGHVDLGADARVHEVHAGGERGDHAEAEPEPRAVVPRPDAGPVVGDHDAQLALGDHRADRDV